MEKFEYPFDVRQNPYQTADEKALMLAMVVLAQTDAFDFGEGCERKKCCGGPAVTDYY